MYIDSQKILVDRDSIGKWYIIDIETGYKIEFNIIQQKAICWPVKITEGDIERAKRDNIDLSQIECPLKGTTVKDVQIIWNNFSEFLKASSLFDVNKVRFHFV